jgi:photosystem II stability/assembly factor-like uncharacterized protein
MKSVPIILVTFVLPVLLAQEPPPPGAPAGPVVAPPPVLEYSGKPMLLPYQCTVEDIQAAGLSCSEEEPCATYLEIAAVDPVGSSRIVAVGNIHSSAVTLYSVLLMSEDSGHTWKEAAERVRGAGLDRIQFLDPDTGWASGELLSPLTQDPFLMVTTDGGRSWRRRPIFSDGREDRFGSIQQFVFAAKDSGSLIVDRGAGSDGDRYELYESPDTGESWTIKETSVKPLRLKRSPPAANPEWRVRADSVTQSFHLEHRQGNRWTTVAAFAVRLAPCKPGQ